MRRKNWQAAPLNDLLAEYTRAASARLKERSPRIANKQTLIILEVQKELRRRGPEAEKELIPLLEHPDVGVRLEAASDLLDVAPALAEPILLFLSKQRNLVAVYAGSALDAWRERVRRSK